MKITNKKTVLILVIAFLSIFSVGCNGEDDSFNISGQVIDSDGNGIENVTVCTNENSLTTDENGKFSQADIENATTLEPVKENYTFSPETKEISSARDDIEFVGEYKNSNDTFGGKVQAHFIDVDQGDSILIKAIEDNKRYKMLIDAGQNWEGDTVVDYLNDFDIETIHLAVGTHAHADHIGGFSDVFNNFEVKKIIDPGVVHTTKTFEEYLTIIDEQDIEFIEGRAGMEKELAPGLNFEILHPIEPISDNLNDESIVGQLRYNEVGFMFTGDVEANGEQEILNITDNIENEILKVSHHGSSTSTTQEFLEAVNPEIGVIQVGDNNYGHPADEVLNRLSNHGVDIYRNDYQGDIVVTTDGSDYSVNTNPYEYKNGEDENEETDKININTADHENLQEITGVGPAYAENIIEYRETHGSFDSIEEIKNVSGIGESRFEDMKDEITI